MKMTTDIVLASDVVSNIQLSKLELLLLRYLAKQEPYYHLGIGINSKDRPRIFDKYKSQEVREAVQRLKLQHLICAEFMLGECEKGGLVKKDTDGAMCQLTINGLHLLGKKRKLWWLWLSAILFTLWTLVTGCVALVSHSCNIWKFFSGTQ